MIKVMNNRGQVLVLFIVMIPIILFLIMYFLESMIITGEKNKLDNLNEIVVNFSISNINSVGLYDGVVDLILKNDRNVVIEDFDSSSDNVSIRLTKKVDSVFGKIIGFRNYDIVSFKSVDINR